MTPDEYCRQKAATSGSSFYYSFLFLPPERRRAIVALYAFCREVDDVVDECREPELARIKLQWWRQELEQTFRGEPRHPVSRALQPAVERYRLERTHLMDIIAGMEMDLDTKRYPDFDALSLYCYRVAGTVGQLSAAIFGATGPATDEYARDLGTALQLTNILRDLREDASRGRVYLPEDELAAEGITAGEVLALRDSPGLRNVLARQAERARTYYERALARLPEAERYPQRSGLIMAAIYQTILAEIERDGFRVLEERVTLTPLRKLWIAWRTASRERRRRRKAAGHRGR